MLPLDQLRFARRFVDELPGDPRTDARVREVVGACFSRVTPTPVRAPELVAVVPEVAALLELSPAPTPALAAALAGNAVVPGMVPYAACYGGHQFGTWAGQLGDGRAITLGEVVTSRGHTWELQLKGAGPTPYARRGDGRAVLRSSLRELVCSEAMFHLGVPTTRALSLALTGEQVERDLLYDGHPALEPGAVVCRVARSFLRFGSFELHAARGDHATLRALTRHAIAHHYPRYLDGDALDVPGFFAEVARRTAWLVTEWLRVGFVHGVMNTDNMSILGLTLDYGPYGWLEVFDPDWTPNLTDAHGRRYRFGHQAQVARWNLAQLGRALAELIDDPAPLQRTIDAFADDVGAHHRATSLRKLGLAGRRDTWADDDALLAGLGDLLTALELDMPLWFRRLAAAPIDDAGAALAALTDACYAPDAIDPTAEARLRDWLAAYAARARVEGLDAAGRRARMDAINPCYVPRNWIVHEVIEATERGDRAALPALLDVLRRPYTEQPAHARLAAKRPAWARDRPGCAMLSCSS